MVGNQHGDSAQWMETLLRGPKIGRSRERAESGARKLREELNVDVGAARARWWGFPTGRRDQQADADKTVPMRGLRDAQRFPDAILFELQQCHA